MLTSPKPSLASLGLLFVCVATAAACGMKGPPLPPLQRIPAAADNVVVSRFDRDVFISFKVPSTNIEGIGTATIDRVEVYGITLKDALGFRETQTELLRKAATLISTQHVRVPLPPPPTDPDKPAPPPILQEPGLDQGALASAHEMLTPEMQQPVHVASLAGPGPIAVDPEEPVYTPAPTFVMEDSTAPRRYYFVVGVTRNGRYGRPSSPIALPLLPATSAPSAPTVTYDEHAIKLQWTPAADARVAPAAAADVLPSRPLSAALPVTRYDVFSTGTIAPVADAAKEAPKPLNAEPLSVTEFTAPGVRFGVEQCFAVRPVDTVGAVVVRGPISASTCETPKDTFAPEAPKSLAAVAGAGTISLIWEPNSEPDLAGYIVLRGEAGTERLTPLTSSPVRETTFRDTNVRPGTRYVYAIVAVDTASPQNVSAQSARVEETAR
jgi:predicted small lipoprotein YifL